MHGDNPHQPLVAVEAQETALLPVSRPRLAAPSEPGGESGGTRPACGLHFQQQFREVPVVGEAARAVPVTEQAFRASLDFEKTQQQCTDAALLPASSPGSQPLPPLAPYFVVFVHGDQVGGVEREQVTGERAAHFRLRDRLGEAAQQALELLGLSAVEHVFVAHFGRANPVLVERLRDESSLSAGAHEHRDVRSPQRLAIRGGLAFRPFPRVLRPRVEEAGDLARRRCRRHPVRVALVPGLVERSGREEPQREGWACALCRDPQRHLFGTGHRHRPVPDFGKGEGQGSAE